MEKETVEVLESLNWLLVPSKRGTYHKLAVFLAVMEASQELGWSTPEMVLHKLGWNSVWTNDVKHWLTQLVDKGLNVYRG